MTDYRSPDKKIPLFLPHSFASTALNKTGSWRYVRPLYDEKTAPCSAACPVGEDIARVQLLISENRIARAWEIILQENPLPSVCGRVCFHFCERACNRAQLDEPIAIHNLERFVGDSAISKSPPPGVKAAAANGKKVAVVGAGPAGLAAAYFLSRLGYRCEVFEALVEPGGILRWGIPAYRLPQDILAAEINRIESLGVKINCNTPVSAEMLGTFKTKFDALFIGCGYGRAIDLKIDGAQRAVDGLQFLYNLRANKEVSVEGTAAVIGGGNTAIDVARTLVRLGTDPILVYRRRRQDMPAFDPEVEMAFEEGVTLKELLAPIRIEHIGSEATRARGRYVMTLQKMKVSAGEIEGRARVVPDGDLTETLRVDHIFSAIGAEPQAPWQLVPTDQRPQVTLSHCQMTASDIPIVYGGDLTNRVKSVTDAIASGKQAAIALDAYFQSGLEAVAEAMASCQVGSGPAVSMAMYLGQDRQNRNPHIVAYSEINTFYFKTAPRTEAAVLSAEDRRRSFSAIESTLSTEAARAESGRCFNCGICNACDYCRLYCPEMSVIVEDEKRRIDLDYCKGCGVCVTECPRNAMVLQEEKI